MDISAIIKIKASHKTHYDCIFVFCIYPQLLKLENSTDLEQKLEHKLQEKYKNQAINLTRIPDPLFCLVPFSKWASFLPSYLRWQNGHWNAFFFSLLSPSPWRVGTWFPRSPSEFFYHLYSFVGDAAGFHFVFPKQCQPKFFRKTCYLLFDFRTFPTAARFPSPFLGDEFSEVLNANIFQRESWSDRDISGSCRVRLT